MTITANDIKLLASQVMDDVPEGGGAPTSTVIVDNSSNGIFNDISELDRAGGRVNLRKVFSSVQTPDVDGYYGVNFIVSDPPIDPNVSITLFSTNDTFDQRDAAATRIESYLAQGPISDGYLFGDHIAGMMSITMLQRQEIALPVNGDTFVLRKNEGLSSQVEQYVRVVSVTATDRTFTDATGDFTRTQVVMNISNPLLDDYPGMSAAIRNDYSIDYTGKTKTYTTIVANAAQYFGIVPMTIAAHIGDTVVQGSTIFTQIVPSTRVETPIADARMNQQANALVSAGSPLTQNITMAWTTSASMFVGGGILPGSLSVTRGGITVTDKGGVLISNGASVGTVDYANGILALSQNVFGGTAGTQVVIYMPAVNPTVVNEAIGIPVTQQGQRLNWVVPIMPIPSRGSLQVSYRTLGRWYVLSDDGSGAIRGGDSSFGAGAVNFTTGTLSLTLGALPDVGSQIILEWSPAIASVPVAQISPDFGVDANSFGIQLTAPNAIKPGVAVITWHDSLGTARTATDGVSGGKLTGDAIGSINYAAGTINFVPNKFPAKGAAISMAVTNMIQQKHSVPAFADGGATWNFTLTAPVQPFGVRIAAAGTFPMRAYPGLDTPLYQYIQIIDDGNGRLQIPNYTTMDVIGAIDYSTGICTINKTSATYLSSQPTFETTTVDSGSGTTPNPVTKISQTGYEIRTVTLSMLNTVDASTPVPPWAWWTGIANAGEMLYAGSDGTVQTYPFTWDNPFMAATAPMRSFNLDTHLYTFNNATGQWMVDADPTTGLGPVAGANVVLGGKSGIQLTSFIANTSSTVTNPTGAATTTLSGLMAESVTFRTAISPLFNGGFNVEWIDQNGLSHSATPDSAGTINHPASSPIAGDGLVGFVDYQNGIVSLRFGDTVSIPNSVAQNIKYLNISGIDSINPVGVSADSLRYNAVGYSYLPLNADILGLDPVRLPSDGRVPIFRAGSFAVIGNTQTLGPMTVTNSQVVDCHRVRLSRVRVIGADNAVISTGYTTDLEAGTVTFVDITGYDQPVTIEHRVEDMALVSDAQINGQITLTSQISHDYPHPGSYISSALVAGDMHARVSLTFDQGTWTNVWSDDLIGPAALASFNVIGNPLVITNAGGLTERWACIFTSSNAFEVVGEHLGIIATGNTATNCSPLNPITGEPYFNIPALGWGLGWVVGNVFRFNTIGAEYPIWIVRTILQGQSTIDDDSFQMLIRGDVNKP